MDAQGPRVRVPNPDATEDLTLAWGGALASELGTSMLGDTAGWWGPCTHRDPCPLTRILPFVPKKMWVTVLFVFL